jgi:predicted dehydrogenase
MLRLALIGCRAEVVARYARLTQRMPGAKIAAIVDDGAERRQHAAQELNVKHIARSLAELLARHSHDFDAVLIHSPPLAHADQAKSAAAAKKHVFVETPLSNSATEAAEIISACRTAGVKLMMGQPSRFLPSVQCLKNSLDSGQLGEPGLLRIHFWEPPDSESSTQSQALTGANAKILSPRLVEKLDLAVWFFGNLPSEVYATGRNSSTGEANAFDYLQVHLGFSNSFLSGGMALITYTRTMPAGASYDALSLIGSTGAGYADDHDNMHLLYRGAIPHAVKAGEGELHFAVQLCEFVEAIIANREPSISGADGLAAATVADAVRRSLECAGPVLNVGGRYEPV